MPVRTKKMGSIEQVRAAIARGSGGALTRIKDKQELPVRFLGEPDTWLQFSEHFDQTNGFYPCADDGTCPGCRDNVKISKKFLVNAVELTEKTVIALVLPVTLAEELLARYDKNLTLMDRVYELSRSGTGIKDTKYRVDYRDPKPADLSRFEPFDLEDLINRELPASEDVVDPDDPDDDVDSEAKVKPLPRKAAPSKAAAKPDLDDDDFAPSRPAAVAKAIKKVAPPAARTGGTAPVKKVLRRPGA